MSDQPPDAKAEPLQDRLESQVKDALRLEEKVRAQQQQSRVPYTPNRHARRAAAAIQRKEEKEKRKNAKG